MIWALVMILSIHRLLYASELCTIVSKLYGYCTLSGYSQGIARGIPFYHSKGTTHTPYETIVQLTMLPQPRILGSSPSTTIQLGYILGCIRFLEYIGFVLAVFSLMASSWYKSLYTSGISTTESTVGSVGRTERIVTTVCIDYCTMLYCCNIMLWKCVHSGSFNEGSQH